jgi:ferritin-like metal-binding protein YciE
MSELDGIWDVERVSGLLPPMLATRKRIRGTRGETIVGPLPGIPFDVVGHELRYGGPLTGFVDVLVPLPDGTYEGRSLYRGREFGRFRLLPATKKEASMGSIDDQLVKHLDEAIAMEENVKRMLDGLVAAVDDPQLIDLFEHHRHETDEHSKRLRERLGAHGASPSVVREATGILGALMKLPLDLVRPEKTGRGARDAYATEHLEIAAYQLLERVAERAGDEQTAAVARLNREEEQAMAQRIDGLWDLICEASLREEGVPVARPVV